MQVIRFLELEQVKMSFTLNKKGRLVKGGPGDWNAGDLVEHFIQARRELTSQIALGIKAADWFADRIAVLVQDYYRR